MIQIGNIDNYGTLYQIGSSVTFEAAYNVAYLVESRVYNSFDEAIDDLKKQLETKLNFNHKQAEKLSKYGKVTVEGVNRYIFTPKPKYKNLGKRYGKTFDNLVRNVNLKTFYYEIELF